MFPCWRKKHSKRATDKTNHTGNRPTEHRNALSANFLISTVQSVFIFKRVFKPLNCSRSVDLSRFNCCIVHSWAGSKPNDNDSLFLSAPSKKGSKKNCTRTASEVCLPERYTACSCYVLSFQLSASLLPLNNNSSKQKRNGNLLLVREILPDLRHRKLK